MDKELKNELASAISARVIEIFKTMFGVDVILVDNSIFSFDDDDLVSQITMHQDNLAVVLRFAFERRLLMPLLNSVYDSIMASHESTMEDAVCEIVNIVGGGLKQHMNESGYSLEMGIPTIDCGFQKYDQNNGGCLNIDFMLDDASLFVDLKLDKAEINKDVN